jgi:hypothetical protein
MLRLVIQQRRAPNTRFHVKYAGLWAAFNTFPEVVDWLHSIQLEDLVPYTDLTDDDLSVLIDREYVELTKHLRQAG